MDSILSILTKDEKDFISHHGIEPSDIFDGRGEIIRVYHAKAKEKGLVGQEGKDYVVKDGDVITFRFNV